MVDIERELQAVTRRHNARAKALDQATAERDRVIRDALDAKLPRARVIAITELSPARIEQIRRADRL